MGGVQVTLRWLLLPSKGQGHILLTLLPVPVSLVRLIGRCHLKDSHFILAVGLLDSICLESGWAMSENLNRGNVLRWTDANSGPFKELKNVTPPPLLSTPPGSLFLLQLRLKQRLSESRGVSTTIWMMQKVLYQGPGHVDFWVNRPRVAAGALVELGEMPGSPW
ncbi:hypothetical protein FB45DRAFT_871736 [Roridomyces roridus]|uniref:Uncharacterized protein n=1 Tax=Roridomyces roridus TaxID=1738132 RepID=A0AAD7BFU4_9AGAR|nr:hypothetical protein FB45DRAFT_871736 [Roridomyces roridus]